MTDLSVIVPTFNRAATLDHCLRHLARQTLDLDRFEVIVADDASTDDTGDVARRWEASPELRVRYRRCSKGFAGAARNRGAEWASADRLVFLGDDVFARSDLLEAHLAAAARYGPESVVVGEVRLGGTPLGPFMRFTEREGIHHDFPRLRRLEGRPVPGWYFYACNASLPATAFRKVGGFDEGIQRAFEDGELGVRLVHAGYQLFFEPGATGTHVHPMTIDGYVRFLRQGREDVARAVHAVRRLGERGPEIAAHPILDRVITDSLVTRAAAILSRTDRALPDAVRSALYRQLIRYERRRSWQMAAEAG